MEKEQKEGPGNKDILFIIKKVEENNDNRKLGLYLNCWFVTGTQGQKEDESILI